MTVPLDSQDDKMKFSLYITRHYLWQYQARDVCLVLNMMLEKEKFMLPLNLVLGVATLSGKGMTHSWRSPHGMSCWLMILTLTLRAVTS